MPVLLCISQTRQARPASVPHPPKPPLFQCRVDLNLIVDYAWPTALRHARELVNSLPGSDTDLCDLLAALREDSVIAPQEGLYADALELMAGCDDDIGGSDSGGTGDAAGTRQQQGVQLGDQERQTEEDEAALLAGGKVAAACRALRAAVQSAGLQDPFFRSVLTALAREGDLGSALELVRAQRERELQGEGRVRRPGLCLRGLRAREAALFLSGFAKRGWAVL